MIPVEKILETIIEQAKQGSCKTCRWCGLFPGDTDPYVTGATHWCMIQAARGINAIHFKPCHLDSGAYPFRCDVGIWHDAEADGIWEDLPECLAYQPGYAGVSSEDVDYQIRAHKHWQFMSDLGEAIHLYHAVQRNTLAKLTAKLNEAKESLPAVPAR